MPKKEEDGGYIISETGNWNVASEFARFKIMMPLAKCDYYEDICKFGYDSIADQLMNYNIDNSLVRYEGLRRLISELLKLCRNCKFALKFGKTKETIEGYEETLVKAEQVLPLLSKVRVNKKYNQKVFSLNIELFEKVLKQVLEIKSNINEPLNKNHLIFTDREEFDPSAFKKNMKDRMINRG